MNVFDIVVVSCWNNKRTRSLHNKWSILIRM